MRDLERLTWANAYLKSMGFCLLGLLKIDSSGVLVIRLIGA